MHFVPKHLSLHHILPHTCKFYTWKNQWYIWTSNANYKLWSDIRKRI